LIDLERAGEVFVLHMRNGENRFNEAFLAETSRALDEVEAATGNAALVTCGEGKFYSNGLDLAWLGGEGHGRGPAVLAGLHALFARLLAFPMATVAALNGHAFAGGGMLAMAHDFRVMRSDRGFFCLPEIDLAMGQPLSDGMYAVLGARLPRRILAEMLVTGHRYGGPEAAELRIVDEAVPDADVLPRAVAIAAELAGKDRATMAAVKRGLHREALAVLEREITDGP
jgi:enoyl-CoA hydratase/carnithine racemase